MNVTEILAIYDAMFGVRSLGEIEGYLAENIAEAKERSEAGVLFTLLNEMVGFCRDTTQREKALGYCGELLALMDIMQLKGSVEYATALLNIANAYRAFGLFEEAQALFEETHKIYCEKVKGGDFSYANLYNNWSLLYQEVENYGKAAEMLTRALNIVDSYAEAIIQQATTRTNLAASLLQIGTEEAYEKAVGYLQEALEIFERDGGRDFHYGAALVAMGDACTCKKNYAQAAGYYAQGLMEIEKHVGKTDNYTRVQEKYDYVRKFGPERNRENGAEHWKTNLERSREFYEQYGRQMIHTHFPTYEGRIAVGMVGEGSDCYGFDDEISADHDYAVGFCMWLTAEDFEKIGYKLQAEYDRLIYNVQQAQADLVYGEEKSQREGSLADGNTPEATKENNRFLQDRRGVFIISDFYNQLLGTACDYEKKFEIDYDAIPEFLLAATTNGSVFRDDLGTFSRVREELLKYYPEDVWRRRLAQGLHEFAQYAQSNYARMMARKDEITARICVGKAVESAMDLAYLLYRKYAPYYKWKRRGLEKIASESGSVTESFQGRSFGAENVVEKSLLAQIQPLLERIVALPGQAQAWENVQYSSATINRQDEYVCLFEEIAGVVLEEMKRQALVSGSDVFLENYVGQVLNRGIRGERNESDGGGASGKASGDRNGENGFGMNRQSEMEKNEANEVNVMDKNAYIEKIVELEWKQFDKVKNEGGRADCQDNFGTFSIMRKSQYLAWTRELLESFYGDLLAAQDKGWNLIMEKYARMMQSTCPEKYAEFEKELPVLSADRITIQEEVIRIQVAWMEEFAAKYPKMAGNARSIRTEEDNEYNTSYETYLRGEMGTYSEETFVLYVQYVVSLAKQGRNLAYEIMENTAKLYGYDSVEDAESKI